MGELPEIGCRQFVCGLPMLGNLAEPGVRPKCVDAKKPMVRGRLRRDARLRAKFGRKKPDKEAANLWVHASTHVAQWSLGGPYLRKRGKKLLLGRAGKIVNAAYRFGAQQAVKLRAVNDLERSVT